MTDPLTVAIAAAARALTDDAPASVSTETQEFLAQVTGSARGELGAWFADHVRFRRLKSQLRLLERVQEEMRQRGRNPREVKLNVLLPLLEAAAVEEEPPMAARWAGLLATAADPVMAPVPPSFPEVLRQLTPLDAALLDWVVTHRVHSKAEDLHPSPVWDHRSDRYQPIALSDLHAEAKRRINDVALTTVLVAVDNLVRLRLLEITQDASEGLNRVVGRTAFAEAFVQACRPLASN